MRTSRHALGRQRELGKTAISDAETNLAVYSTNIQDHVECLWVKCEGSALV